MKVIMKMLKMVEVGAMKKQKEKILDVGHFTLKKAVGRWVLGVF